MRVVSLAPGATEILFALGLGDAVVGVGEGRDWPPEVRARPVADGVGVSDAGRLAERLAALAPELIFLDRIERGNGATRAAVRRATRAMRPRPAVYVLAPTTLGDVLSDVKTVGDATGTPGRARALLDELKARIDRVTLRSARAEAIPRVLCLDSRDPPRTPGRWVPELIGMAGGHDGLAVHGRPPRHLTLDEVVTYVPEAIVIADRTDGASPMVGRCTIVRPDSAELPVAWREVPAARTGRIYAVDAAYLARPGPRLVDGLEMLASLLHPALFGGRDWANSPALASTSPRHGPQLLRCNAPTY